ncbi:MAG: cytochrome c [Myxococcales bacterium]|nr:MAG: cytochrome c [Myxococcales bacterium]
MMAWKDILSQDEIRSIIAYLITLYAWDDEE